MIKWGILGTGKIAHKFAEDFKYVTNARLVAVGSRAESSASSFAQQYDIPKSWSSYEQLVQDPEIDVVYISTPHNLHCENTLLCLEHGKSVLCEKPIAVNQQELGKMTGLAQSKGLFLMEALWTYFLPSILKAQEWIREGRIGQVEHIKADFGFRAPYDPGKRLFNPALAGGALLDVGIYPIAFSVLFASAKPRQVLVNSTKAPTGVDLADIYSIHFENGITADLSCSLGHPFRNDGFIYGTQGYIELPLFWKSSQAVLHRYDEEQPTVFEDQRTSNGYNFETREVTQALLDRKTESEVMPLSKSKELLSIMDEIRAQAGLKYPFES